MKNVKLIFGLLMAAGFSTTASAHDYLGTLGAATTATDKFYISCAAGTAKYTYQVRRTAGAGGVQLKSTSPVAAATVSSGAFSPLITVTSGAGAKFFTVNKSPASGAGRSYTVRMHCYDAAGNHNPEDQSQSVTYQQNQ